MSFSRLEIVLSARYFSIFTLGAFKSGLRLGPVALSTGCLAYGVGSWAQMPRSQAQGPRVPGGLLHGLGNTDGTMQEPSNKQNTP